MGLVMSVPARWKPWLAEVKYLPGTTQLGMAVPGLEANPPGPKPMLFPTIAMGMGGGKDASQKDCAFLFFLFLQAAPESRTSGSKEGRQEPYSVVSPTDE